LFGDVGARLEGDDLERAGEVGVGDAFEVDLFRGVVLGG
jgi:hypothetical protein